MKLKLIIPLLVLCLTLSVISVQAQTDTAENMTNVNMVITGNTAESITCNVTGTAALVGMDNTTGTTENITSIKENVTGRTGNITGPVTCNVTGKVILIRNMGNMTENVIVIGRIDNVPGKMIMFGKTDTGARMTERMDNMTRLAGRMNDMAILMVGNMTGTMTCNMTGNTENMTGVAERTNNMTGVSGRAENMRVLMNGDITGTLTYDLTEKMVLIRNMGNMNEVAGKMCNISETAGRMENITGRMENLTGRMENVTGRTGNMTEPMICNMTGRMIVLKDMDNMASTAERMDKMGSAERMNSLIEMDENTVIIGDAGVTRTDGKMDNLAGADNVTGKVVVIRNLGDTTQIVTRNIMCNITAGNTTTVRNIATRI